jgi:hypothetical protein
MNENHLSWRLHDLWSDVEETLNDLGQDVSEEMTRDFNTLYNDLQRLEEGIVAMQKFTYGLEIQKVATKEET